MQPSHLNGASSVIYNGKIINDFCFFCMILFYSLRKIHSKNLTHKNIDFVSKRKRTELNLILCSLLENVNGLILDSISSKRKQHDVAVMWNAIEFYTG